MTADQFIAAVHELNRKADAEALHRIMTEEKNGWHSLANQNGIENDEVNLDKVRAYFRGLL